MSINDTLAQTKDIKSFFVTVCKKVGIPKNIYAPVIDGLIKTSLRGVDSHGIRLMPHYIRAVQIGRINKNPNISLQKTSLSTSVIDADHTFGITAGNIAMKQAIKIAKKTGISAVAVKNSTHFGAAAIYSLLAARNNMIGLSFTHTDSLVLPFGGRKAYLGTNPICFAAPCEGEDPLCLDMATSQIPWNKLLVYRNKKQELDSGWAADKNGLTTKDPDKAVALLPFGGYKGYGLAFMIEILSSLLTGMPFGSQVVKMYPLSSEKRNLGHFFIAINIAAFEDISIFKKRMASLMRELRTSVPSKGFSGVKAPGDPEKEIYKTRSKQGIPLYEKEREEFLAIAQELRLDKKYFTFL